MVGSGPSAFYATKYLLANPSVQIDMYEKLPFPFGLVRYGVAPDHPEVKSVIQQFSEIARSACAAGRFRYFGNTTVSDHKDGDINLDALDAAYSAVLFAYGASEDHPLAVPGAGCQGVLSARQFVNWYNGHPDHPCVDLSAVKHVVVVGHGNVALDCARVLGLRPSALAPTDITSSALQMLAKSAVQDITVIGRRGHVQAAFTIKELRELTKLNGTITRMRGEELKAGMTAASAIEVEQLQGKKRIVQLMETIASTSDGVRTTEGERTIDIRFLCSPEEVLSENNIVTGLRVQRTVLAGEPFHQSATPSGVQEVLPADLILTSIGYKGSSLSPRLPFLKGIIVNTQGRVTCPHSNYYCAGWIKRGPSGIIGTNIPDARETVACILEDISSGKLPPKDQPAIVLPNSISWEQVERLEAEEVKRGEVADPPKPREKIVDAVDVHRILGRSR